MVMLKKLSLHARKIYLLTFGEPNSESVAYQVELDYARSTSNKLSFALRLLMPKNTNLLNSSIRVRIYLNRWRYVWDDRVIKLKHLCIQLYMAQEKQKLH